MTDHRTSDPKLRQHKDLHDAGWAPGNYSIRCIDCGEEALFCDKRACRCRPCAEKRVILEPPTMTTSESALRTSNGLLNCPFCGAAAHLQETDSGFFYGECTACEATAPGDNLASDAVALWNRRAAPETRAELPYYVQSFWSPNRKYLVTAHATPAGIVSLQDDNGREWETASEQQDMTKECICPTGGWVSGCPAHKRGTVMGMEPTRPAQKADEYPPNQAAVIHDNGDPR